MSYFEVLATEHKRFRLEVYTGLKISVVVVNVATVIIVVRHTILVMAVIMVAAFNHRNGDAEGQCRVGYKCRENKINKKQQNIKKKINLKFGCIKLAKTKKNR